RRPTARSRLCILQGRRLATTSPAAAAAPASTTPTDLLDHSPQPPPHRPERVPAAHLSQVAAGEPVDRRLLPVRPQPLRLVGRRDPIAAAGDDEATLARQERPALERRV